MRHPAACPVRAGSRMEELTVKRFLLKADRVIEKVGDWALILSGVLILVMGFLTTYGVGKRYIFHDPDPYTYELSIIFLMACILLCLPAIQWNRRNLRVDFILSHFSQMAGHCRGGILHRSCTDIRFRGDLEELDHIPVFVPCG